MQASNSFRRVVPGTPYFFGVLLFVLLGIIVLFSLYLEFLNQALLQIGLSPKTASIALVGIIVGGFINVPIHRKRFSQVQLAEWTSFYYHWADEPFPMGVLRGNTIAINIGGAVVPLLLASWLLLQLKDEPSVLFAMFIAGAVNVGICYRLGKVVRNVGITLPGWLAPIVGVSAAWLLLPAGSPHYSAFAFTVAVMGPFIGADLLNLKRVPSLGFGTMSIGGAGPLDGILLSGVLAAWLVSTLLLPT